MGCYLDPELIALLERGTKRRSTSRSPRKHSPKRRRVSPSPGPSKAKPRQSHPKAANYELIEKNVLQGSWSLFRAIIAFQDPFPTSEDVIMHALTAWKKIAEKLGHPELAIASALSGIVCPHLHSMSFS